LNHIIQFGIHRHAFKEGCKQYEEANDGARPRRGVMASIAHRRTREEMVKSSLLLDSRLNDVTTTYVKEKQADVIEVISYTPGDLFEVAACQQPVVELGKGHR
jgi:hypothetical protein